MFTLCRISTHFQNFVLMSNRSSISGGHQLPSPSPQALGGVPLAFCISGFDCSEIIVKVVGNLHVLMMSFLHRQMLFLRFCNPALVSGEVVSL